MQALNDTPPSSYFLYWRTTPHCFITLRLYPNSLSIFVGALVFLGKPVFHSLFSASLHLVM